MIGVMTTNDEKHRDLIDALNRAEAEAEALRNPRNGMSTGASRAEAQRRLRDVLTPRIARLKREIKAVR